MQDNETSYPYFDVWPLGIIAHEMMSGKLDYGAMGVMKMIR